MPKEPTTSSEQSLIDEWLAKGNEITVCEPMAETDPELMATMTMWGRGRKKKATPPKKPAKKG